MAAYDQVAAVALKSRGCAEMRAPTGDRSSHELIPLEVDGAGWGRPCSGSVADHRRSSQTWSLARISPSHTTSEAWQLASHDTSGFFQAVPPPSERFRRIRDGSVLIVELYRMDAPPPDILLVQDAPGPDGEDGDEDPWPGDDSAIAAISLHRCRCRHGGLRSCFRQASGIADRDEAHGFTRNPNSGFVDVPSEGPESIRRRIIFLLCVPTLPPVFLWQ